MGKEKTLIVLVGPTAVGKTVVSISLAHQLQTEIISCDSRQFFREMEIGTAKPTKDELQAVTHHFINNLSIHDPYTIADFEREALACLEKLFTTFDQVIMTGGSGLYVKAVCEGLDSIPEVDPGIRIELQEIYDKEGLEPLRDRLRMLDPRYYERVDRKNPQRIMRALEVCLGSGRPFSDFLGHQIADRPFRILKIGLDLDRKQLYDRINRRMDTMIEEGLFKEATKLFPQRNLNALQTVGYKEIFEYMEGKYDRVEAIRLLKRNSRRYAKRQLTWFHRDPDIHWFKPNQVEEIEQLIGDFIKKK